MKKEEAIKLGRKLRKETTPAEKIFWEVVRDKRFRGKKFYRQYLFPYKAEKGTRYFFLDFYCFTERLAIELDGPIHEKQKERDLARSSILEASGLRVLRFKNEDLNDIQKVKTVLEQHFINS